MKWNVIHAGERHTLEVSPDDTVEVFKLQVFSLLDIPPESLSIRGVTPSALNADAAPLATLNFPDDADIVILSTADLHGAATPPPPVGPPDVSVPANSIPSPNPAPFPPSSQPQAPGVSAPDKTTSANFAQSQPLESAPGSCSTSYDMDEALARRLQLEEDASIAAQLAQADRAQQRQQQLQRMQQAQWMQQVPAGPPELQKYLTYISQVQGYEDPNLQAQARAVIPLPELERRAKERVQSALLVRPDPSSSHEQDGPLTYRDALLRELLHWFKGWFRWANIVCERCQGATSSIGMGDPTPADLSDGANRVELHRCASCRHVTRFPRYNAPARLLQTRMGRCGEWANAFTLCCRTLGYDARLVLDPTDHVWTECYSEDKGRWLHLDPCEDVLDRPHLYEAGWGKKLSYIIAISTDAVTDVSRRYSTDWAATVTRRRALADESSASRMLAAATTALRAHLSPQRRQLLFARDAEEEWELSERVKPGPGGGPGAADLAGVGARITGDASWREARGEMGPGGPGPGPAATADESDGDDVRGIKEEPVDDVVADISEAVQQVCGAALLLRTTAPLPSVSGQIVTRSDLDRSTSDPAGTSPARGSNAGSATGPKSTANAAAITASSPVGMDHLSIAGVAPTSPPPHPPSAVELLRALLRVLSEVISRPKVLLPLDLGTYIALDGEGSLNAGEGAGERFEGPPVRTPPSSSAPSSGPLSGGGTNNPVSASISAPASGPFPGPVSGPFPVSEELSSQLRLISRSPSAVSLLQSAGCKFSSPAPGDTGASGTGAPQLLAASPTAGRVSGDIRDASLGGGWDTPGGPPSASSTMLRGGGVAGAAAASPAAAQTAGGLAGTAAATLAGGMAASLGSSISSATVTSGDGMDSFAWLSTRRVGRVRCARIMVRAALPDVAGAARRSAQLRAAGAGTGARGGWVCASAENPPHEKAIHAFDGRLDTKWLGKLDGQGSAWLQYRWKGAGGGAPAPTHVISHYRLTSANDAPERDPSSWVLEGSIDGQRAWEPLDTRGPYTFRDRFAASEIFAVTEARRRPFSALRLRITAVRDRGATDLTQLCLFELFHPLAQSSPPAAKALSPSPAMSQPSLPAPASPSLSGAPVLDARAWQAKFKEVVAAQFAALTASGRSPNEAAALAMKAATEICGRPPS